MDKIIDWKDENLCYHVIDYGDPLDESRDIVDRVTSILTQGLLTARELGRSKHMHSLTPDSRLDVFSAKMRGSMGEEPKINLSNIVFDVGTTVGLLLRVPHEECLQYPHSLVEEGTKPKILALVIDDYSPFLVENDFLDSLQHLANTHGIQILNRRLDDFNKALEEARRVYESTTHHHI